MLKHLRNSRKGETCTILGNGPSLRDMPVGIFDDYFTMGSNKIYLLQTAPDKAPEQLAGKSVDLYCAINPTVTAQNAKEIVAYDVPIKIFSIGAYYQAMPIPLLPNCYTVASLTFPHFSRELTDGIYEGFTVTFALLQIAYYMGFTTVLLAGVDHRYEYEGAPNALNDKTKPIANHFHAEYYKDQEWNNPDLLRSEAAYRLANQAFKNSGRKVINVTPDSALKVFEKAELKNV